MKYARICIAMVCIFHYVHYVRVWSVLDFALFLSSVCLLLTCFKYIILLVYCQVFFWNCFQKCYTFVIFSIFTWLYSSITDTLLLVNSQFLISQKLFCSLDLVIYYHYSWIKSSIFFDIFKKNFYPILSNIRSIILFSYYPVFKILTHVPTEKWENTVVLSIWGWQKLKRIGWLPNMRIAGYSTHQLKN